MDYKQFDRPRVLVAEFSVATTCYLVHNELDVLRAKAKILRMWEEDGLVPAVNNYPPQPSADDRAIIDLSADQVHALPEPFKTKALKVRRRHADQMAEFEHENREGALVAQVLSAPTIDEAIAIRSPQGDKSAVEYLIKLLHKTTARDAYVWMKDLEPVTADWN